MLKRGLEIILHLLFWGATGWFIIATFAIEGKEIHIINGEESVQVTYNSTISGQLAAVILLAAMASYATVITIGRNTGKKIIAFLLSAVYPLTGFLLFILLRKIKLIPSAPVIPFALIAGILLFYYIAGITYTIARLWQKADLLKNQMETEKKEAELSLLRSQLHPHFLFNVLNSLLSMVDRNGNPAMTKAILGLSDLLRYVVNESGKGQVSVQKELEFIKNYSALQRLRFEANEIDFNLNIYGNYSNQYIEPGIFIPFLENAFKYGAEPEKVSEINVNFDFTAKGVIKFSITNRIYPELRSFNGNGFGLTAAKRRLEMVYPNRHRLHYGPQDGLYIVNLEIRADEGNNS